MNTFHSIKNRPLHGWNGGFTLLELMVAISILVMLCGLVMQLMGSATRLTSTSKQSSDCDSEARFALSQIASDLGRRIRRPDVDAFLDKTNGNDRHGPRMPPTRAPFRSSDTAYTIRLAAVLFSCKDLHEPCHGLQMGDKAFPLSLSMMPACPCQARLWPE